MYSKLISVSFPVLNTRIKLSNRIKSKTDAYLLIYFYFYLKTQLL